MPFDFTVHHWVLSQLFNVVGCLILFLIGVNRRYMATVVVIGSEGRVNDS